MLQKISEMAGLKQFYETQWIKITNIKVNKKALVT